MTRKRRIERWRCNDCNGVFEQLHYSACSYSVTGDCDSAPCCFFCESTDIDYLGEFDAEGD